MSFRDLDDATREFMLLEFDSEQASPNPFRSRGLSTIELQAFPRLIRDAISGGDEGALTFSFLNWDYWNPMESYTLKGVTRQRRVNLQQTLSAWR